MKRPLTHDVIILGAGISGLTLASLLADTGLRIALLDQKPFELKKRQAAKPDLKVFAITPASEAILRKINVWPRLTDLGVSPFRTMQVWQEAGSGRLELDSREIAKPHMGHIIENAVLMYALLEKLQSCPQVQCLAPYVADNVVIHKEHVVLEGAQAELTAKLIVGADGANSWLRQSLAIPTTRYDYQQHAVVTTVQTEQAHQQCAYQRFLRDGILALLPLADKHLCSIVWSTDSTNAKALCALADEKFNTLITARFAEKLGWLKVIDNRVSFPLFRQHAQNYVSARMALLGDAAHSIHPLAGQGLNLGIMDAAALAQVIVAAVAADRDIGHVTSLRRYERARKGENLQMMYLMDGFKSIFAWQNAGGRLIRDLGLKCLNQSALAKQFMMRFAGGYQ